MEVCKKVISDFNKRHIRANFSSIRNGASIVKGDITSCTIPEFFVPKEIVAALDDCGFLDGEKDNQKRNLTPEAIETFKNIQEQP